jgi:hypothetical protein
MQYLLALAAPALVFVMLHLILAHLVLTVVFRLYRLLVWLLAAVVVVFIARYSEPEVPEVLVVEEQDATAPGLQTQVEQELRVKVIAGEMVKALTEAHIELAEVVVLVRRVILLTQYPVLQVAEALV